VLRGTRDIPYASCPRVLADVHELPVAVFRLAMELVDRINLMIGSACQAHVGGKDQICDETHSATLTRLIVLSPEVR